MDELHAKLGICDLAILVRERRLRWFGHVMRSNGEINRVRSRPVPGRKGPGRPKKTWEECVKQDLKVCGLSEAGTQDRLSWRSSVKNSRQEPTPSNGSLPQSMAEPPARRVLGMRTRSFNKTGFDWLIDWSLVSVQNRVHPSEFVFQKSPAIASDFCGIQNHEGELHSARVPMIDSISSTMFFLVMTSEKHQEITLKSSEIRVRGWKSQLSVEEMENPSLIPVWNRVHLSLYFR